MSTCKESPYYIVQIPASSNGQPTAPFGDLTRGSALPQSHHVLRQTGRELVKKLGSGTVLERERQR